MIPSKVDLPLIFFINMVSGVLNSKYTGKLLRIEFLMLCAATLYVIKLKYGIEIALSIGNIHIREREQCIRSFSFRNSLNINTPREICILVSCGAKKLTQIMDNTVESEQITRNEFNEVLRLIYHTVGKIIDDEFFDGRAIEWAKFYLDQIHTHVYDVFEMISNFDFPFMLDRGLDELDPLDTVDILPPASRFTSNARYNFIYKKQDNEIFNDFAGFGYCGKLNDTGLWKYRYRKLRW